MKGRGGIYLKRGRNKVIEKLNLNMPYLLKRYAWAALLLALSVLFFQAPDVLSAGEGEKKAEDIKGSMSLETVSREWGTPTAYLIEGLKLPIVVIFKRGGLRNIIAKRRRNDFMP
jgi:hypothetical protein